MAMNIAILLHRPRFPLPLFMFCWWRHNRLLMTSLLPDNCDATTWQVISNSLDIDFIHGDIHDRSCKENLFYTISAVDAAMTQGVAASSTIVSISMSWYTPVSAEHQSVIIYHLWNNGHHIYAKCIANFTQIVVVCLRIKVNCTAFFIIHRKLSFRMVVGLPEFAFVHFA